MKSNTLQIGFALILVGLLVLLSDPFMLWMPPMVAMVALLSLAVLMCAWLGFVMKEQAQDEREALNRMHAGRVAYLSGAGVLTLALVVQGFVEHHIDPWIAGALGAMVLAKLAARAYFDTYR